ncbi:acetyl-CoA C-acyltransferase [Teredinibacter sp. KSP-S5-2]|uniref:thiolase family protein n=1 Tax=Teredinibacter sp. KSP-S5-2 TaxID=3034506 RepID=UPI002934D59D|nr:acetyl-CoA C-acyltransferase [Teredinibacter sp. KSP-S5-2]WNO08529.1 acetyl-CoA C-acyltransferase [Teredinibacter sp. KSP-S5-2]
MSESIVVVGLARTPMGGMQGALGAVTVTELGAVAIKGALHRAQLSPDSVDEVMMGCVLPAGVGQAPARQAAIAAEIPSSVPACTVNKVCGSGMKTVMQACNSLLLGENHVVVAGGMESMSNAPYLLSKARQGYRLGHGELLDHMFIDGLQDAYENELMGVYAENTADKYNFSRQEQDAFAIDSLNKANAAILDGAFESEIAPVTIKNRKETIVVSTDEQPGNARPEKIPGLKPAFRENGTVTAANSSSISDGAAALVLMRKNDASEKKITPLAEVKGFAQYAQAPEWFTTAPVGAMQKLLAKIGWSVDDVDLFEINEAFAVVTMAAMKELHIPKEKVNVHGGACALGHPLGASGARILVTLISALQRYGKKKGIASLCIGGGEAVAMAVEVND